MASTRDIRRRIKSVKNTRQITKAMELVAASKMKRAQQAALAGRPYTQVMARMLSVLAGRVEESQHAFLTQRPVRTRGILLVTSDKPGTAMRSIPVDVAGISLHRPGTIVGKALEPLASGEGEILVLLSLQ